MNNLTLQEFLVGTMLGDGCISRLSKGGKNYRWSCGHGEKQLEYLQWKVDFLVSHDLHTGNITKYTSHNKRYKTPCTTYHTKSRTNVIFNHYRKLFYPKDNIRIFPELDLTPNILSILYMDDGHLLRRPPRTAKAVFNLHSFMDKERDYLCSQFKRFDIKATSRHKNGEVAVSAYDMDKFRDLITPLKMFQYKMGPE